MAIITDPISVHVRSRRGPDQGAPSSGDSRETAKSIGIAAALCSSFAALIIAGLFVTSIVFSTAAGADPEISASGNGPSRPLSREWVWKKKAHRFDTMWRVPR